MRCVCVVCVCGLVLTRQRGRVLQSVDLVVDVAHRYYSDNDGRDDDNDGQDLLRLRLLVVGLCLLNGAEIDDGELARLARSAEALRTSAQSLGY